MYGATRRKRRKVAIPRAPEPTWIGHNRGPKLTPGTTWTQYAWRRSQRRLWRTPGREVYRRRVARAAELGLSYRQYVSVLLDRGARLEVLAFTRRALFGDDVRPRSDVTARLAPLRRCLVLLLTPAVAGGLDRLLGALAGAGCEVRTAPDGAAAVPVPPGCPPATVALIGEAERARAEAADLGLYLERRRYFAPDPTAAS